MERGREEMTSKIPEMRMIEIQDRMDADTWTSNGRMAKRLDADHRTWLQLDLSMDELLDMRLLMLLHSLSHGAGSKASISSWEIRKTYSISISRSRSGNGTKRAAQTSQQLRKASSYRKKES